jgi:serine/threonine-protein kinase
MPPVAPRCVVPRLKGKKLAAAKKALRKAHCAVGKVTKRRAGVRLRGKVLSSKPRAGSKRPAGTRVALIVAK